MSAKLKILNRKEMVDMAKETPCDYGDCPFGAEGGYNCRNYCGLGVDVACDEDDEFDYDEYVPSSTRRDYGPSNPWDAPGMSVKDFL